MNLSNGKGDRIFGVVVVLVAVAYGVAALQFKQGFIVDPVGPKTFPLIVAGVSVVCGLMLIVKPDPDPEFPPLRTAGTLLMAMLTLVAYAYAIKPLGFLIPTAIAAAILSYQIDPRAKFAVAAGLGLSGGLYVLFKFVLGLGLLGVPKGWF